MKLQHKKMPFSVNFRLNPQGEKERKKNNLPPKERLLQFIITVDTIESSKVGVTISGQDRKYILLFEQEWNAKGHCVEGNTPLSRRINARIAQIKHTLNEIYDKQFDAYAPGQEKFEDGLIEYNPVPRPTWQSVMHQYKTKKAPWAVPLTPFAGVTIGMEWSFVPPTLGSDIVFNKDLDVNQAMIAFRLEMRTTGKRTTDGRVEIPSKVVLAHFDRAAGLLKEYAPHGFAVKRINPHWIDGFHEWMQTQPERTQRITTGLISRGNATRFVRRIRELVKWLHRSKGAIAVDPTAGLTWHGHDKKDIVALSREELSRVETLVCRGTLASARFWFLVMAYTGFSYEEAQQYILSPSDFEVLTPAGMTLQGKRLKKPHVPYCIPRVSQIDTLLAQHPVVPRAISPQKLNKYIRDVLAEQIGFVGHLTIRVARKTAAIFFLEEQYSLAEVSRVLGHKRVATTEGFYLSVTNQTVIRGMERVNKNKGEAA